MIQCTVDPWTSQVWIVWDHLYTDFFPVNIQSDCLIQGFVSTDSTNSGPKIVFSVSSWESVGAKGWLYSLFYVILYKELEHTQILVSVGVLEPIPCRYWGMTIVKFWGSQKFYVDFWVHGSCSRVNYNQLFTKASSMVKL